MPTELGSHELNKQYSVLKIDVAKYGPNAAAVRYGLGWHLLNRTITQSGKKEYIRDGYEYTSYPIGKRAKGCFINRDWTYLSNKYGWMCDKTYRDCIKILDIKNGGDVSRMLNPKGKCVYRVSTGTTVRRPDWYGMTEKAISGIIYAEPEDLVHFTPADALAMGISDAILFNRICFLFEIEKPEQDYLHLGPAHLSKITGLKPETVRTGLARLVKRWQRLERIEVKGRAAKYKLTVANSLAGKFVSEKQDKTAETPAPVRDQICRS